MRACTIWINGLGEERIHGESSFVCWLVKEMPENAVEKKVPPLSKVLCVHHSLRQTLEPLLRHATNAKQFFTKDAPLT